MGENEEQSMGLLILLRHGQSVWNEQNIFTGWVDIPLSVKGIDEALNAGTKIKDLPIDVIFTSTLIRAQMTAMLSMSRHASGKVPLILHPEDPRLDAWSKIYSQKAEDNTIPVVCAWELNERMYGELQGMNKAEMAEKFGAEQIKIWRRSYDIAPPEGESLEMTAARSLPYFKESIVPYLEKGKNVLVSAHGNSLRSIIMELDGLSKVAVVQLEIPTGVPITYKYTKTGYVKQPPHP
jgi:2,3-bisphosphoglycerate-dependent phosphoglycerate mutase